MIECEIEFEPDEEEEARRQDICNAMDVTPGLAAACSGKTWRQIFKMCNQITEFARLSDGSDR